MCIGAEILALLLLGPFSFFASESTTLIFLGLAVNGIAIAGVFVPIIPMLVSAVEVKYRTSQEGYLERKKTHKQNEFHLDKELENMKNKVADSASSLQALFSGFSAFIAPIISGGMADTHGYKSATNLMAMFALASGLVFVLSYRFN
jgi:hypothetical protein